MARGEANERGLFERIKGSDVWWIRWSDQDGKVHREMIGPKSAAQIAYRRRKEQVRLGQKIGIRGVRDVLTVGHLVGKYAPEMLAGAKNEKCRAELRRELGRWETTFGAIHVEDLQPGDVEAWKGRRISDVAPATVNRSLAILKRLFNLAIRDCLTERNPLARGRVKMLRENNIRERVLSEAEESQLVTEMPEDYWRAALFALHTGLRRSEQLPRKRGDYDKKKSLLRLPDSKGGGRAYVRLNRVATAALEEQLASHGSEWIWPATPGPGHITGDSATHRLQRAAERLGLEAGLTWHSLRHTYISRLVLIGIPLPTVQRLARHKSIQMTLRYAHLAPGHEQDAIERLADAYPR